MTPLADVGETIRLAVAPVFLLTAVAGLLAVMVGRLGRIIDRSRELSKQLGRNEPLDEPERAELGFIPRRIKLIEWAVFLSVAAGLLVCFVIALLFVSSLVRFPMASLVALAFITAMALMMASLASLLVEVRLALRLAPLEASVSQEAPTSTLG